MTLAEGNSKIAVTNNITDKTKSTFYVMDKFLKGFENNYNIE